MDFKQFVEHWASVYKPMMHTPGVDGRNKRFFFCDGFAGMADWMRQQNFTKSPVVVMESGEDGDMDREGKEHHDYVIYFCVRAKKQGDGVEANISKKEALAHARRFVQYVNRNMPILRDMNIMPDTERISFVTMGPMWDAWNMVQIRISVGEWYCNDVEDELYDE